MLVVEQNGSYVILTHLSVLLMLSFFTSLTLGCNRASDSVHAIFKPTSIAVLVIYGTPLAYLFTQKGQGAISGKKKVPLPICSSNSIGLLSCMCKDVNVFLLDIEIEFSQFLDFLHL